MITKFKIFEKAKPEIDEKTIRIENKDRGWYIDLYFDDKDRLDYVDNKWDIRMPNWYGFSMPLVAIRIWAKKYDERCEVYNIFQHNIGKYNL